MRALNTINHLHKQIKEPSIFDLKVRCSKNKSKRKARAQIVPVEPQTPTKPRQYKTSQTLQNKRCLYASPKNSCLTPTAQTIPTNTNKTLVTTRSTTIPPKTKQNQASHVSNAPIKTSIKLTSPAKFARKNSQKLRKNSIRATASTRYASSASGTMLIMTMASAPIVDYCMKLTESKSTMHRKLPRQRLISSWQAQPPRKQVRARSLCPSLV